MDIAVVILNYNSLQKLKKCIESFEISKTNDKFYYIIIDNKSKESGIEEYCIEKKYDIYSINNTKDSIKKVISKNSMLIKLDDNYGYSYANNIGARIANNLEFQYIIIANPDTEIIDISKLDNIIKERDFLAIFPKVIDTNNKLQSIYISKNAYQEIFDNLFYPVTYFINRNKKRKIIEKAKENDLVKIDFSIGCFIIFNMKKFNEIGYFDDRVFLYNEEKILMEKAKMHNFDIFYTDKITIMHNHIYKKISKYTRSEGKKSKIYYYKEYKKYSNFMIKIIQLSENFKRIIYDKLLEIIKGIIYKKQEMVQNDIIKEK